MTSSDLSPKRALSQNFLLDKNIIQKIIAAAEIQPDDLVFEIGPGQGSLTEELFRLAGSFTAIEKDSDLVAFLKDKWPKISVVEADFLDLSIEDLVQDKSELLLHKRAKIVANIPYHITTPLLKKICENYSYFGSVILMVQKEFAEKLCNKNKDSPSFSLALIRSFCSQIEQLFGVSRHCFFPRPKVDSAVVRLVLKSAFPMSFKTYADHLRKLMEQKRKKISSGLKRLYPSKNIPALLQQAGLKEDTRPADLTEAQWIDLICLLEEKNP